MAKVAELVYKSVESTRRSPLWWILALAQVSALFGIGSLVRPSLVESPFLFFLCSTVIILPPVTLWLWWEIEARYNHNIKQTTKYEFMKHCFSLEIIILCAVAVSFLARLLYPDWIFMTIVSSLVAATSLLAMLYSAICNQNFSNSWRLALDTWHKKVSLALVAALTLIIIHGISFALAHEIDKTLEFYSRFSVFTHSATIWILLFLMVLIVAFVASLLNCFLVFLFLEIINRQKNQESEEAAIEKLAVVHPQV